MLDDCRAVWCACGTEQLASIKAGNDHGFIQSRCIVLSEMAAVIIRRAQDSRRGFGFCGPDGAYREAGDMSARSAVAADRPKDQVRTARPIRTVDGAQIGHGQTAECKCLAGSEARVKLTCSRDRLQGFGSHLDPDRRSRGNPERGRLYLY